MYLHHNKDMLFQILHHFLPVCRKLLKITWIESIVFQYRGKKLSCPLILFGSRIPNRNCQRRRPHSSQCDLCFCDDFWLCWNYAVFLSTLVIRGAVLTMVDDMRSDSLLDRVCSRDKFVHVGSMTCFSKAKICATIDHSLGWDCLTAEMEYFFGLTSLRRASCCTVSISHLHTRLP